MSAVTEAAESLWVTEAGVQQLLERLPAAAEEAGAPAATEQAVTALLEAAQRHIEKAHELAQKHLVDTGQPVPASGGGNKPPE